MTLSEILGLPGRFAFEPERDHNGVPVISVRSFPYGQVKVIQLRLNGDPYRYDPAELPRAHNALVYAPGISHLCVAKLEVDPVDYTSGDVRMVRVHFHRYVGMPYDTPAVDAANKDHLDQMVSEGHVAHFA